MYPLKVRSITITNHNVWTGVQVSDNGDNERKILDSPLVDETLLERFQVEDLHVLLPRVWIYSLGSAKELLKVMLYKSSCLCGT